MFWREFSIRMSINAFCVCVCRYLTEPHKSRKIICRIKGFSNFRFGETGRPLAVRLREHRHNLKQGLLEKSKLAKHTYEEGYKVGWDEARVLDIESHSKYRKYKEAAPIE
jgi:hypothetical protein